MSFFATFYLLFQDLSLPVCVVPPKLLMRRADYGNMPLPDIGRSHLLNDCFSFEIISHGRSSFMGAQVLIGHMSVINPWMATALLYSDDYLRCLLKRSIRALSSVTISRLWGVFFFPPPVPAVFYLVNLNLSRPSVFLFTEKKRSAQRRWVFLFFLQCCAPPASFSQFYDAVPRFHAICPSPPNWSLAAQNQRPSSPRRAALSPFGLYDFAWSTGPH